MQKVARLAGSRQSSDGIIDGTMGGRFVKIYVVVLATTFLLTTIGQSEAARRETEIKDKLFYVTMTRIPDASGKTNALCHLLKVPHLVGLPLWGTSGGYVLSQVRCRFGKFTVLTKDQFVAAQNDGLIDPEVPAEPKWTFSMVFSAYFTWFAAAGLAGFTAYQSIARFRRRSERKKEVHKIPLHQRVLLEMLCFPASSDGKVGSEDVDLIRSTALELTGRDFNFREINMLAEACDGAPARYELMVLADYLDQAERETIMRAVLKILSDRKYLTPEEKSFMADLTFALKLSEEDMERLKDSE